MCPCTDINECLQSPSPCEQNCHNTEGSFMCSCHDGYLLADDQQSCNGMWI